MKSSRAFHEIQGDTSITVLRDRVWVKPWHLLVSSGHGTAHSFFWTRRGACRVARWISLVIGDALEAAGK
jgi:hypothetical protein